MAAFDSTPSLDDPTISDGDFVNISSSTSTIDSLEDSDSPEETPYDFFRYVRRQRSFRQELSAATLLLINTSTPPLPSSPSWSTHATPPTSQVTTPDEGSPLLTPLSDSVSFFGSDEENQHQDFSGHSTAVSLNSDKDATSHRGIVSPIFGTYERRSQARVVSPPPLSPTTCRTPLFLGPAYFGDTSVIVHPLHDILPPPREQLLLPPYITKPVGYQSFPPTPSFSSHPNLVQLQSCDIEGVRVAYDFEGVTHVIKPTPSKVAIGIRRGPCVGRVLKRGDQVVFNKSFGYATYEMTCVRRQVGTLAYIELVAFTPEGAAYPISSFLMAPLILVLPFRFLSPTFDTPFLSTTAPAASHIIDLNQEALMSF